MRCSVLSLDSMKLWTWWLLVGFLARAASFNHWLVTEEGKIEYQVGSPFNLKQPFNLLAFLHQEERVSSLEVLREELLDFRNEFEEYGNYDSFEDSFYALDQECRLVQSLTSFDVYISTVLPLEHKKISLSDYLDPANSRLPGEPFCRTPLDFSIYALEHLTGVQNRRSLVSPPERSVLASVNMRMEVFGSLVHHALEQNKTSWVLLDLATLYWRARGNALNAIECIRRALHYSPVYASDIAHLNLANILHRSRLSSDAVVPLQLATSTSPSVNVLHYALGNVYVALGRLNDSLSEYRRSLALEPTSDPVRSIYHSVLCELKKMEASMEYSRKLELTQAKLDTFYEKVELVKRHQVVGEGEEGRWDVDTEGRGRGRGRREGVKPGGTKVKQGVLKPPATQQDMQRLVQEVREAGGGRKEEEEEEEERRLVGEEEEEEKGKEGEEGESGDSSDTFSKLEGALDSAASLVAKETEAEDSGGREEGGGTDGAVPTGSDGLKGGRGRSGSSRLRLVLRPLPEADCEGGAGAGGSPSDQSSDDVSTQHHDRRDQARDCLLMEQPICKMPVLFGNYSVLPSGFCPAANKDCLGAEHPLMKDGKSSNLKKSESVANTAASEELYSKVAESLNCALGDGDQDSCLRAYQESLGKRGTGEGEKQETEEGGGEEEERKAKTGKKRKERGAKQTRELQRDETASLKDVDASADGREGKVTFYKPDESEYSPAYQAMEFLPYNPLPAQLEETIFPDRARPLATFDDPYWPSKADCLRLVDSLRGTASALASFTGTFLSPEARGVDVDAFFTSVPSPIPPYLRRPPRCTDIVELPFTMAGMDHLYPVMYRSTLTHNSLQTENGLKKVLINAVSHAIGRTLTFEESGEAVYAAMVKNGPNWALFTLASLFWRVSGNPHHAIECLRRSLHYCPNSARDVGLIGLANVFHRHGFMNEAVIAARAALDVSGDSPVGHYTLAGVYLSLREYVAASLHLRVALHSQPAFEHAMSALRLVRCSLKFKEEQEFLKLKMKQTQEKLLREQEAAITSDLERALESLERTEKIRQPPIITKPLRAPEMIHLESTTYDSPFTGEDAVRYITNLALMQKKRKREAERAKEEEREREREREDGEREEHAQKERLTDQQFSGESSSSQQIHSIKNTTLNATQQAVHPQPAVGGMGDGGAGTGGLSGDRGGKGKRQSSNGSGTAAELLDRVKLSEDTRQATVVANPANVRELLSQVQLEEYEYDPQLEAQEDAKFSAELEKLVASTARAIANDQTPVQHTAPARVKLRDKPDVVAKESVGKDAAAKDTVAKDTAAKETFAKDTSAKETVAKDTTAKETGKEREVKRYPGYRPWPSLQECAALSLPKSLVFTSTWLSVTAKGVKVKNHIDFGGTIGDTHLLPYCPNQFEESSKTLSHLAGMSGSSLAENYKPERGLMEVLCNLSGSYRPAEEIATRISLAMEENPRSWVLSNLAALYWRVVGKGELAVKCLKHALHHSDEGNEDVALVSLANVLYRMGYESDATAVMQHSLEVSPKLVVNHFTMANVLAARGFAAEAAGFFESTLRFQPGFEPAAERLKTVRCISLMKHIKEQREREQRMQRQYEQELEERLRQHRIANGLE